MRSILPVTEDDITTSPSTLSRAGRRRMSLPNRVDSISVYLAELRQS